MPGLFLICYGLCSTTVVFTMLVIMMISLKAARRHNCNDVEKSRRVATLPNSRTMSAAAGCSTSFSRHWDIFGILYHTKVSWLKISRIFIFSMNIECTRESLPSIFIDFLLARIQTMMLFSEKKSLKSCKLNDIVSEMKGNASWLMLGDN